MTVALATLAAVTTAVPPGGASSGAPDRNQGTTGAHSGSRPGADPNTNALSHRLPEQYPEPDAYRPDRFTPGGVPKHSLIGFGCGVHRCLGSHFAYLEMRVVVTMLLRHYELELLDEPVPVRGAGTKWPQSPCRVRYRARTQPPRAGSAAG